MLGEENKYTWCEHYEHVVRRKGRYGAKFVNTGAEKVNTFRVLRKRCEKLEHLYRIVGVILFNNIKGGIRCEVCEHWCGEREHLALYNKV